MTYTPEGWLNTVTVVSATGNAVTTIAYDAQGQIVRITAPDGSSLAYTYDGAHRRVRVADAFDERIDYTLDAMGNRTVEQISTAGGAAVAKTQLRVFDDLAPPLWWTFAQTSRPHNRGSMRRNILFDRANDEWDAGNVRKAFELFSQAAAAGDPFSQTSLGYFYGQGIGVKKDAEKAIWWYRKAARKGTVAAINNLAITYRDSGDLRRARSWFKKALSKGDGDAALELAKLSLTGRRQDVKSAKNYLKVAASSKYILSDSKKEARRLLKELNRR